MKENISVEATCRRLRCTKPCAVSVASPLFRGRHALPHLGQTALSGGAELDITAFYILAAWMKLFAATRSKRKFNNPVSFNEESASRPIDPEPAAGSPTQVVNDKGG
jgi:hypothetical protein